MGNISKKGTLSTLRDFNFQKWRFERPPTKKQENENDTEIKHEKKKKYRDDGGCVLDSELAAAQLPMPSSSHHVR